MNVAYANRGRWTGMEVNLRVYEAQLKALCEIGQTVEQLLDLDRVLEEVLKALSRSLATQQAMVVLLEPDSGKLILRASCGLRPSEIKKGIHRLSESTLKLVLEGSTPFILPKSGKAPLFGSELDLAGVGRDEIAFLGAPILMQQEIAGILILDSLFPPGIAVAEDIHFLKTLTCFLAQFILLNHKAKEKERRIERRNESLEEELAEKYNDFVLVGNSQATLQLRAMVDNVATSATPVMLLGEQGTERALVARMIHKRSHYADGPFIRLNCATIEEEEGRDSQILSGFEKAEGGTLFLDSIDSLPGPLQARLTGLLRNRNLETQKIKKTRKLKTDSRIIVASEKDLSEAVTQGHFRQDLYYRLTAFPLHIPPLRERREDIPLLAEIFLRKAEREYGRKLHLTPIGLRLLKEFPWSGNTCELENFIHCISLTMKGPVMDPDTLSVAFMHFSSIGALQP
jgi:Nif-specific regulatory protein